MEFEGETVRKTTVRMCTEYLINAKVQDWCNSVTG